MASKRILMLCLFSLVLSMSILVEAQFFTKPSSKSIPRMGRSSQESPFESDKYRHILINNLLDNYGPRLMEALLKEQQADRMKNRDVVYTYESAADSTVSPPDMDRYKTESMAVGEDELALQEPATTGLGEMLRRMARNH